MTNFSIDNVKQLTDIISKTSNIDEIIDFLEKRNPNDDHIGLYLCGFCYDKKNKYLEAFICYEKVLELAKEKKDEAIEKICNKSVLLCRKRQLLQRAKKYENNKNYHEVMKIYHEIAEIYSIGHVYIGLLYKNGLGINKDIQLAYESFLKGAALNCVQAYYEIGNLYLAGYIECKVNGPNFSEAAKWYELAAEKNNTLSQYRLGKLYEHGEGVPQNYEQAFHLYSLGVGKGDSYCQYSLGNLYLYGLGVVKDIGKAIELYKLASKKNHSIAQCKLGTICCEQKKYIEAIQWFDLSVTNKNPYGYHGLGEIYKNGWVLKKIIKKH